MEKPIHGTFFIQQSSRQVCQGKKGMKTGTKKMRKKEKEKEKAFRLKQTQKS